MNTRSLRRCRSAAFLFLFGSVVAAAGCSPGGARMVKVHGKVSLDSVPVTEGAVQFQPVDGEGQSAGGVIQNGEYTADVPVGRLRVSVQAPKVVGKRKPFPDAPEVDVVKEMIPEKYNTKSKLEVDVKSDTKELDFDLKSKD